MLATYSLDKDKLVRNEGAHAMNEDLLAVMLAALQVARAALEQSPHIAGITEQALWDLDEAIRLGTEALEPIPTPEVRDSGFVEFEEAGGHL